MRDRIFYSICFGFILGVLVASLFKVNFSFNILILFLSCISLIYFYVFINKWGVITSFFFLFISLGILYFNFFTEDSKYLFLDNKVGQRVEFLGVIVDDVIKKPNTQNFILQVENQEKQNTKILVSTNSKDDFQYGDVVLVSGKLDKPNNFITDNNKEFDYINYLKKDGVFYLISFSSVEVVDTEEGNRIKSFLFKVKNSFLEKIYFIIPPYESNLLGGLILGERASFPEELTESFIKTGTIHIVALSGYNVSIIAEWFIKLLSFLPFIVSLYGAIFVIILFVLMTGAYATSVRAGIMAILVLIAKITGRNYDVLRALVLTSVLMILFNPYTLYFDISFQLSFIATIAVIFFTPKIEKYFLWLPKKLNIRDIISVTFSAYIFVLPFILYKMGNLSLVALPSNFLVLPLIPPIMLLGFITGIFSYIFTPIAFLFGYITYLLLKYELGIINFLGSLSFSSVNIPNFPLFLSLLIYLYLIYFIFGKNIEAFFKEDF